MLAIVFPLVPARFGWGGLGGKGGKSNFFMIDK